MPRHTTSITSTSKPTRRQFLGAAGAAGVGAAGVFTFPQPTRAQSPNERVRVAAIGTTNRAGANIREAKQAGR